VAVSYEVDIRPLFRTRDIDAMRAVGGFDLSVYQDVVDHADAIKDRLKTGSMPCDGAWPPNQVSLFERWIADGKQP
jgi:hypothetical protein